MLIRGTTKIIGIIGYPVQHSLSPVMQNAALQACGADFVYVPFEVKPDDLENAIKGLKGLGVAGFNVTVPHKTAVIPFMDELSECAEAAGAVNTVKNDNGRFIGYNTDGDGLVMSLINDLAFDPNKSTIAILGAGGAAQGGIAALCRSGAKRIYIANRSKDKAEKLVQLLSSRYFETEFIVLDGFEALTDKLVHCDLLINTTAIGMKYESIPGLSLKNVPKTMKVYDMVYVPSETPLLGNALSVGLSYSNGQGMLIAQGELAFAIWIGKIPPSGLMRSALKALCSK